MVHSTNRVKSFQDLKDQVTNGSAVVIDVRTANEYGMGHLENAVNIPVGQLLGNLSKLDSEKIIVTCCASGMRSELAKNVLIANGFSEVYNAGGWQNLLK